MDDTRPTIHDRDTERAKLGAALPAYEIGAVLGRGAFAVVYAARHRHLEREVAVKRLSPDLLREGEARGRFAAEARLLASLDHPHVVRVYDYVEEEDVCAFVMERMHGGTLADRMAGGRVDPAWACAVMLGALHGLEHAHRKGVLHRDVKPENLLFDEGSQVKVADFGIAKVVGAQGARLTATAAAIGTPAYMAPEQVTRNAGPLSSATDVWSAGAVLYELLAEQPPFPLDGDLADVLLQRVTGEAVPLHDVAPDTPRELAEVVMRALASSPDDRYATPGAFAAALEPVAGDLAPTQVPVHRTAPRPGDAPLLVETRPGPARPARARRRRPLVAALAGAVAAVAAVLVLVVGGSDPQNANALPPPPKGIWPAKLTAAFIDQKGGAKGTAQRLGAGGTTYDVFYGDAEAKKDWSHDPEQERPSAFIKRVADQGLFPYLSFYSLRLLGQTKSGGDGNAAQLRQTLQNAGLMRIYWKNVRKFLIDVGRTKRAAAISLDSNFWSYLEQSLANNGGRATSISATVGLSGLSELQGIPDNLPGIAAGWRALRDKYAPKAALGYQFDDWAANGLADISRDDPPTPTVVDSARQAGEFFSEVAATQLDFAALTINGDGQQEGQNTSAKNNYSTAEKDKVVAFVREFVRTADTPVVLEGVPLGNTVYRTIDDTKFHWHDTWVQWLLGDKDFTGLRKLHDAGVIGVLFGTGYGETETCPCDAAADGITNKGTRGKRSTSKDDDGGYFAERMAALDKAGGFPLTEKG